MTKLSFPSRSRIVGIIELSGRLPGAIVLASDCVKPNIFGEPGCAVKSSISSFKKKPSLDATAGPKIVVERIGICDGVAGSVHHRKMGGVAAVRGLE